MTAARTRRTFYATPSGRRYHRHSFCEGLNAWATAHGYDTAPPTVTAREIQRRDLTPCEVCKPSSFPGLTVVGNP